MPGDEEQKKGDLASDRATADPPPIPTLRVEVPNPPSVEVPPPPITSSSPRVEVPAPPLGAIRSETLPQATPPEPQPTPAPTVTAPEKPKNIFGKVKAAFGKLGKLFQRQPKV